MGLSGEKSLGEAKTKALNSDFHENEPSAAARQAEVLRDYLKCAATLTSRATHAHPTSPRSTGFCAIWDCISSSSSSQRELMSSTATCRDPTGLWQPRS